MSGNAEFYTREYYNVCAPTAALKRKYLNWFELVRIWEALGCELVADTFIGVDPATAESNACKALEIHRLSDGTMFVARELELNRDRLKNDDLIEVAEGVFKLQNRMGLTL